MAERRTQLLVAERAESDDPAVVEAAAILRAGGLVAFPTETVYGLGAWARDAHAVRRIFAAKGRPAAVPLIVHVADLEQARRFVAEMTEEASVLAERFWPGPLTLVLERSGWVPDAVAGGGATVGVRSPAHPMALALIEALGDGIAAPSANRYGGLPPVRAEHVIRALDGRIDAVLDGGMCPGGLESTVVDARGAPLRMLRRGAVELDALSEHVVVEDREAGPAPSGSLGWLHICEGGALAGQARACGRGERWAVVVHSAPPPEGVDAWQMPADARGYAAMLYDALHGAADSGCTRVLVEMPPATREWDAVRDRLARLAATTERGGGGA